MQNVTNPYVCIVILYFLDNLTTLYEIQLSILFLYLQITDFGIPDGKFPGQLCVIHCAYLFSFWECCVFQYVS